jgi:hypothetical protein
VHRLIRPQPRCSVAGCVRFSSQASDFVVGAGSFYLSCIFVSVQVRFLFLRAVSGDDGFVRNVLASSLRRGGNCESSRFCGALVPVVSRCASGSRTGSRRSWRGSCRWVFSASDATRWCRVTGSCGGFHAFSFLDDSGERLTMLVSVGRRDVRNFSWKTRKFANRSFRFLFACSFFVLGLCVWGCTPL